MKQEPLFVAPSPRMTSYETMELLAARNGWPAPKLGDRGRWQFGDRHERYHTTIVSLGTGEYVFAVYPWEELLVAGRDAHDVR